MKKSTFSLLIITIITLISATILEKFYGTPWVASNVYGSWWFVLLWAAVTITALIYIIQRRLYKQPYTLLLHLSFVVILLGALVTHYYGINGQIHLRMNEEPNNRFIDSYNQEQLLPFYLTLENFDIIPYPGTNNPMDYVSHINILETKVDTDESLKSQSQLSMNNIASHQGYRFYQTSYDSDLRGSILSVYYDPYGITITYIGYFLLFVSMTLFLFNRFISLKRTK